MGIKGQINATKGHVEGTQSEVGEAVIKSKWGKSSPLRRQRDIDCDREQRETGQGSRGFSIEGPGEMIIKHKWVH